MGQVHRFLGLTRGPGEPRPPRLRRQARRLPADVTYGTNTEFGFDYLRDNMARSREVMVQRGHVFAIVDEVDSILIDEARTPLIISGPGDGVGQALLPVRRHRPHAHRATRTTRSTRRSGSSSPTEAGIAKVERQVGVDNLYDLVSVNYVHQLTQALRAKELFHRDKDYLVRKAR